MVERLNQTLQNMMGILKERQKSDWNTCVPTLTRAHNATMLERNNCSRAKIFQPVPAGNHIRVTGSTGTHSSTPMQNSHYSVDFIFLSFGIMGFIVEL